MILDIDYDGIMLKVNGHRVEVRFYPHHWVNNFLVTVDGVGTGAVFECKKSLRLFLKRLEEGDELTVLLVKLASLVKTCKSSREICEGIVNGKLTVEDVLRRVMISLGFCNDFGRINKVLEIVKEIYKTTSDERVAKYIRKLERRHIEAIAYELTG